MLKPILKRISIDKNKMFINSNSNNNYINSYYSDYNSNNNLEYYNSKEKDSNLEETVVKPTVVKKFSICLVDDDNKSIQSNNKIKPRVRFSFNKDTKPKQNHNRSTSHYPIKLNNDNDDDNKLSQNVRNRKTSSTEMNSVTTVTSDDSSYYEYFGGRIKKPSINQKTNYFEYQDNDYSSSLSSSSFDSNNKKNVLLNNGNERLTTIPMNSNNTIKKSYKIILNGSEDSNINQNEKSKYNRISNNKNKNISCPKTKSMENNILPPPKTTYYPKKIEDNLTFNIKKNEIINENKIYDEKNKKPNYINSSSGTDSLTSNSTSLISSTSTELTEYEESKSLIRLEKILNYKFPRLNNFNELKLKYGVDNNNDANVITSYSSLPENKTMNRVGQNYKDYYYDGYDYYFPSEYKVEENDINNKKSFLTVIPAPSNSNKYHLDSLSSKNLSSDSSSSYSSNSDSSCSESSSSDNSISYSLNFDSSNYTSSNTESSFSEDIKQKSIRPLQVKNYKNNKKINRNRNSKTNVWNYYNSYYYNNKYYNESESDTSSLEILNYYFSKSSEMDGIPMNGKENKLKSNKYINDNNNNNKTVEQKENIKKTELIKIPKNELSKSLSSSSSSFYSNRNDLVVKEKQSSPRLLVKNLNVKSNHKSNSKNNRISKNGYYISSDNEFCIHSKNGRKNNIDKKLYKIIKKYLDENHLNTKDIIMIIVNDKLLEGNDSSSNSSSSSSSSSSRSSSTSSSRNYSEKKHRRRNHHHKKRKYSSDGSNIDDKQYKNNNISKSNKKNNKKESKKRLKDKSQGHSNQKFNKIKENVYNYNHHHNNNDYNQSNIETDIKENESKPSFFINSNITSSIKPEQKSIFDEIPTVIIEEVSKSEIETVNTPKEENDSAEQTSNLSMEQIPRSVVDTENLDNESISVQSSSEVEKFSFIISEEKTPKLLGTSTTSSVIYPLEIKSKDIKESNIVNNKDEKPIENKEKVIPLIELTHPSDENTNSNISIDLNSKSQENSLSSLNDETLRKLEDLVLEFNESLSESDTTNSENNTSSVTCSYKSNNDSIDSTSSLPSLKDIDVSHVTSVPSKTDFIVDEDNNYLSEEIITESDSINVSKSTIYDYSSTTTIPKEIFIVNEESNNTSKEYIPSLNKHRSTYTNEEPKLATESTEATKVNSNINDDKLLNEIKPIDENSIENLAEIIIENYQIQTEKVDEPEKSIHTTLPLTKQDINNSEDERSDVEYRERKNGSEHESENENENESENENNSEWEYNNESTNSKESLEKASSSNKNDNIQILPREIKLEKTTQELDNSTLLPSASSSYQSPNILQPKPLYEDHPSFKLSKSSSPIDETDYNPIPRFNIFPDSFEGQSFIQEIDKSKRKIDISKFISNIKNREENLKAKENEFLKVIDEETEKNKVQKNMIQKTSDELDDKMKEVRHLSHEVSKHKKILLEQKEANDLLQEELEEEKKQALSLQQQLYSQCELNSKQEQEISYYKEIHNMYLEENQRLQALLLKLTNPKSTPGASPFSIPSLALPPPTSPSISAPSSPKNPILSPTSSINTLI